MAQTGIERISGQGGFTMITGTDAVIGQFESLVVNTEAVISALEINGSTVLAAKGLSGVTLAVGMYLPTDPGFKITKVTLASGSLIAYK